MGLLTRLLGRKSLKKANIVLLGASGAGKTTFIRFLESGLSVEDNPMTTLGIDVRRKPVKVDGWNINTIDVGGQQLYQKTFWNLGMHQADALVYIIDGTNRPTSDSDAFEMSLFSFEYMLELLPPSKPILILINKQDLNELNPLTKQEAYNLYPIEALQNKNLAVKLCSAKHGKGVLDSVQWLFDHLD